MSGAHAGPTSGDLDDLIARHLDGGLDPEEQRRLARLLAESPTARQKLARYLRLEAAVFRLAAARQLAVPVADQGGVLPAADGRGAADRGRRLRLGVAILAAGLLVALVLAPLVGRWRPGEAAPASEIDLLAEQWLRLNRAPTQEPVSELASELADESSGDASAVDEPDDDDRRRSPPPSWLVAAVAEAEADPTSTPDEG